MFLHLVIVNECTFYFYYYITLLLIICGYCCAYHLQYTPKLLLHVALLPLVQAQLPARTTTANRSLAASLKPTNLSWIDSNVWFGSSSQALPPIGLHDSSAASTMIREWQQMPCLILIVKGNSIRILILSYPPTRIIFSLFARCWQSGFSYTWLRRNTELLLAWTT